MNISHRVIRRCRLLSQLLTVAVLNLGCTLVPGTDIGLSLHRAGAPVQIGGFDSILVENIDQVRELNTRLNSRSDRASVSAAAGGLTQADQHFDEYRVGVGDILTIIVWEHPELTNPAGEFRDSASNGRVVSSDGTIFYPYAGVIGISGLTVAEIRREITEQLSRVIRDPQVDVRVAAFRSKRARISGYVQNPTAIPLDDVPLTVRDAINLAGGISSEGYQGEVLLRRGLDKYSVALYGESGSVAEADSVFIKDGDIVQALPIDSRIVYVTGAVARQAAVPMSVAGMNLQKAILAVGGIDDAVGDRKNIFVIRGVSEGGNLERLSIIKISENDLMAFYLASSLELGPGDIIYVDRTGFASFNTIVRQLLPTVSTLFQLDRLIND